VAVATEFKMPEVGEGIESGVVVALLVAVGDTIEVDQPVLELETDKAVVEVPSNVAGVVTAINVAENAEAQIGQVILTVDEAGAGAAAPADEEAAPAEAPPAQEAPAEAPVAASPPPTTPAASAPPIADPERYQGDPDSRRLVPAAPSVRRLAREMGIDIRAIQGSGTLGRISADDVRRFAETGSPLPAAAPSQSPATTHFELPDFSRWGEVERQPMSGIRKATVRTMTTAWATVPMVTHFDKADSTEFEALRQRYKPAAEALSAKLTPTAMLIKVVASALHKFPDFNASIDTATNEIIYKRYINVGVAVDTDNGLLVPVIKNADRKNMLDLAVELGDLAAKARDRKLGLDEMQGGNFSVSNLGGIGGTGFTPIVNPPDVAILGVARGGFEPVYDRETGEFVPRMMMPLALTYDHRLIDGAAAAKFLRWVCRAIEEPFLMALEG
jgi:pyruvate dehydrogenase E2 component (dihydrolipoamide acetyltransferase)